MGLSVSLQSLSPYSSTLLIGAACFVAGYFLALNHHQRSQPPDERQKMTTTTNKKNSTRSNLRFLSWAQSMLSRSRPTNNQTKSAPSLLEIENLAHILQDFKMVLVVRNDLKMGKGKIAAQCSHATLGLYKKLHNRAPKALDRWEMCGQVKVVLKIESEEDMLVLQARAKSLKLPTHVTVDAGRTQIAPNSRTVMAILGPADIVDDVTGGLKLL